MRSGSLPGAWEELFPSHNHSRCPQPPQQPSHLCQGSSHSWGCWGWPKSLIPRRSTCSKVVTVPHIPVCTFIIIAMHHLLNFMYIIKHTQKYTFRGGRRI